MKENKLYFKSLAVITALIVNTGLAANIEHLNTYNILGSKNSYSFQNEKTILNVKNSSHSFLGEAKVANISSFEYSYGLSGNQYHAAFSHSQEEQHGILGYTLGGLTVSAMTGDSESFLHDAGSFQGVNRFGFHGGNNVGFSFQGAGIDAQLFNGVHTQFGFAKLASNFDNIESRGVRYFELSSQKPIGNLSGLYSRFSVIDRGDEQVGQALEAGFNFKKAAIMLQGMEVDGNKRMFRAETQLYINESTQIAFDVSHTKDPSHFDDNRYAALLSLSRVLGVKPKLYFGANDGDVGVKQKKKFPTRPVLIGAGLVAVAAIASSGDEDTDTATRSRTERDAAFEVLNGINPRSVNENREYGGWVYRNQDNTYGSSSPVRGTLDSVSLPDPSSSNPAGSTTTASYHTHGGPDPRYDNENFSPTDINGDIADGVAGYLATPGGQFLYHSGGNVQNLGTVAN